MNRWRSEIAASLCFLFYADRLYKKDTFFRYRHARLSLRYLDYGEGDEALYPSLEQLSCFLDDLSKDSPMILQ